MPFLDEWTVYRVLAEEEHKILEEAVEHYCGSTFEPVLVSTQVTAGTNYQFICNAMTTGSTPKNYIAKVLVFKPLRNAEDTKAAVLGVCEVNC